jgi:hypothetical protein
MFISIVSSLESALGSLVVGTYPTHALARVAALAFAARWKAVAVIVELRLSIQFVIEWIWH